MLATPGFHHLHLNSVDPDAAIDFYIRQFPTSAKGSWGGFPALLAPNNCMILFTKVATPPVSEPQGAIWHFGWHVPDARATLETLKNHPEVALQPLYTTDEGGSVLISSDTWPYPPGVPGRTLAQPAEWAPPAPPRSTRRRPPGPVGREGRSSYIARPTPSLRQPSERNWRINAWRARS